MTLSPERDAVLRRFFLCCEACRPSLLERYIFRRVRKISQKATVSFVICLSVWNNSVPTGPSFIKFYIWVFFEKLSRKFKFHSNLTRITGTLHEDYCTFLSISRSVLLWMRNVSDKGFRGTQNTNFMFSNFFLPKIAPFMRWCGKGILERGRAQMTIWRMRVQCWIPKATNTHSQHVILFFRCNSGC
jgi:hypothetical protein